MKTEDTISRRSFLGAAAAATAFVGVASGSALATASDTPVGAGAEWDAEFDVVVCGFGDAGGASAVSAAMAGAKVLIVEKAPVHLSGGNSRYAGQGCWGASDAEANGKYVEAVLTNADLNMPADVVEAMAQGVLENQSYMNDVLGLDMQDDGGKPAYKSFPGSESYIKLQDTSGRRNARILYALMDKCAELGVEVWYETPAKHLIQDPATKTITGVQVEHDGQTYNVRAVNGVVMCVGGYENNMAMLQSYTCVENMYPAGGMYNTGDGVKMCGEVGAELWHLGGYAGAGINFVNPNTNQVQGAYLMGPKVLGAKAIFVGGDGTRFCDESTKTDHGDIEWHGSHRKLQIPNPCYAIFDQAIVDSGPIFDFWSDDNSELVDMAYAVKADTLEELGEQIGVDGEGLAMEVAAYNGYCAAGEDSDFGRAADYLIALETAPYYAMEVFPSLLNTLGGPKKNGKAEVLDFDGNPIPHLYCAGECGSVFNICYQGTGNVSECMVFGRVAGANAAAAKGDSVTESQLGGKTPLSFAWVPEERTYDLGEGEYVGSARGMGDELVVKVRVENGAIAAVDILEQNETPMISDRARELVPAAIVEANSVDVDVRTGATTTTNAIKNAVRDALSKAGISA